MSQRSSTESRRARIAASQRAAQQRERRRRLLVALGAAVAVLAILAGIVLVQVLRTDRPGPAAEALVPPAVMADLTNVPADVREAAGTTGVGALPTPLRGAEPLRKDGKPYVLYVGANYCPFCASQRWALVAALTRFGSFEGLRLTTSAADDVYPSTPTLSFSGATYRGPYLAFDGLELSTNERVNGRYAPLDVPTPEQRAIMDKYNAAPYVDSPGAIPFIDYGNRYLMQGSGFSPGLLTGKTQAAIAATLRDPASSLGKTINGNANVATAALCSLTDGKPASACASPAIAKIRQTLDAQR